MSGRASAALAVVICAVLMATLTLFGRWRRETRLESGSGELKGAFLALGDDVAMTASAPGEGWVLMSIESLEFSSEDDDETVYRATTWDARTGKRLARVPEVAWRACAPAGRGRVWCHTEAGALEVVRVPQLTVEHDAAAVSAKVGQKVMNASQLDVTDTGRLRATLADGHLVELEAATLSISPPSAKSERPSAAARLSPCAIPNSQRQGVCARGEYGNGERVDATEGWLHLQVLGEVKGGWLLAADTSLDDATSQRRVIRVDEQFKETGSTTLGSLHGWETLSPVWVTPDELFFVVVKPKNLTVGIWAATGREAFRIEH